MAMAATSRTGRRRPSSRRMPRSLCGTSPRIPTARRTILPACATPDAMWWGSCPIRSAVMRWFWVVRTAPASSSLWRLAMRRSTLAICALLMVATSGCDQVNTAKAKLKLAWDKLRGRSTQTAPPPPPARLAPDTAGARVVAQQEQAQHPGPRAPSPPPSPSPCSAAGSMTHDRPSKNEDEYFARRDAELLRQHRESARRSAAAIERKTHYMKCPKCGYDLITGDWDGVQIEQCTNCHGIWCDADEVKAILKRPTPTNNILAPIFRAVAKGVTRS